MKHIKIKPGIYMKIIMLDYNYVGRWSMMMPQKDILIVSLRVK